MYQLKKVIKQLIYSACPASLRKKISMLKPYDDLRGNGTSNIIVSFNILPFALGVQNGRIKRLKVMKLIIDIKDDKVPFFLELLDNLKFSATVN